LVDTLVWRADCHIDELCDLEELPEEFQGHDFIQGTDNDGRPIMISRFGGMDLEKVFGDVEAFVRYRVYYMERCVRQLAFAKGAPEDLCQVHDYSGVPLMFPDSVKISVKAISKVFADHYPEMKGVTAFVNFPSVFAKLFQSFAMFLPERTRKKFQILGTNDHAKVFEIIPPQWVPDCIGGMLQSPPGRLAGACQTVVVSARDAVDVDALSLDAAAEIVWEVRVCVYEVAYKVLFVSTSGEEQVCAESPKGEPLLATDNVASGRWTAPGAGLIKVRFHNEAAWFKSRLCICRVGLAQDA